VAWIDHRECGNEPPNKFYDLGRIFTKSTMVSKLVPVGASVRSAAGGENLFSQELV